MLSEAQTPSAFTFALNSKSKQQGHELMDMRAPSPLGSQIRSRESKEEQLKQTENELFSLERELAQLSHRIRVLLAEERESKSLHIIDKLHEIKEVVHQKEERIDGLRKERDSLLEVLY